MNIVGIIGGIGPESTVDYYQTIITKFQERLGSKEILPELVINSINMYKIFELISNGKITELVEYIAESVQKLARAGRILRRFPEILHILFLNRFKQGWTSRLSALLRPHLYKPRSWA
ncbi:hypothetical protein RCG17_10680 [Neobacillus sp. PS3-12]|uniref:hypothetical protein n=1 Tax=Neobacillus sp. PS3-12 TaxID=3070677 RepID=UPI0027DF2A76|nr:hypothetical protein [Neobacillus sp. PS3-12]WML55017.1 hypothetical protein RCG17_10680 [Neobacillus sp. PS3-12]